MTLRRGIAFAVLAAVVFGSGCVGRVLRHDEDLAARQAQAFVTAVAIRRDFAGAYEMLDDAGKRLGSQAAFEQTVQRLHPQGYPTTVNATEFEPVPGQAAIQIFLTGENGAEKFYYRVPLSGTADSGYRPTGFFRGNQPYPSSNLRQRL